MCVDVKYMTFVLCDVVAVALSAFAELRYHWSPRSELALRLYC